MHILSLILQIQATFYVKNVADNKYIGSAREKEDIKMVDNTDSAQKVKILFFAPTNYFKIERANTSTYLAVNDGKLSFEQKMAGLVTNDIEKDIANNNRIFEIIDTTPKARIVVIKQKGVCLEEKDNTLQMVECKPNYDKQTFELVPAVDDARPEEKVLDFRKRRDNLTKEFFRNDNNGRPERDPKKRLFYPFVRNKPRPNDDVSADDASADDAKDTNVSDQKPTKPGDLSNEIPDDSIKDYLRKLYDYLRRMFQRPKPKDRDDTSKPPPSISPGSTKPPNITLEDLLGPDSSKSSGSKIPDRTSPAYNKPSLQPDMLPDTGQGKGDKLDQLDADTGYAHPQKPDDIDYFADAFDRYMKQFGDDMCKLVYNIGLKFLGYAKDRLMEKKERTMQMSGLDEQIDTNKNRDLFFGTTGLQTTSIAN